MTARPIRNNNPFDLRDYGIPWKGLVGRDDHGLCIFATPADGLDAGFKNLVNAQRLHDRRTVRAIITPFAPPNENDTEKYIEFVACKIGVDKDAVIDLEVPATAEAMGSAMIRMEDGAEIPDDYGPAAIAASVARVLVTAA